MSLVPSYDDSDESDNEEDDEKEIQISRKRRRSPDRDQEIKKLPLPQSLRSMFSKEEAILGGPEDSPADHEGRIRSFPHVRGNWATYVYANQTELQEDLTSLQEILKKELESKTDISFHCIADPHLSFTKVLTLRHHWIDSFMSSLKKSAQSFSPFLASFTELKLFVNDEKSRSFLGAKVAAREGNLEQVVIQMNEICQQFGLPSFYDPPELHVSLLWALGDLTTTMKPILEQFNFHSMISDLGVDTGFWVNSLQCKCGNKNFEFALSK